LLDASSKFSQYAPAGCGAEIVAGLHHDPSSGADLLLWR
jgi:hypothetical protein